MSVKILYLVHDLADPAVERRVRMLDSGGAAVTVAGFRRGELPPESIAGRPAIDLGRTHNGKFLQRILAVLREVLFLSRRKALFAGADIVIARNLEMLGIAVRGRGLCAVPPVLVYESLDIHRLLLGGGPVAVALRGLEGWLSRRARALLTSSPAFVRCYFDPVSSVRLPVRLVENKVFSDDPPPSLPPRPPGPPWRIGWFGAIRCAKSLRILSNLARRGDVEVIIRGRPAFDQIPGFDTITRENPRLRFLGPYKNPHDLAAIYGEVHFTWAIDMFEEGQNSSWLLPNRLYEGGLHGTVPVAVKGLETGNFLDNLGIGVTVEGPLEAGLGKFFDNLTQKNYQVLEKSAMEISKEKWRYTGEDCKSLVAYLAALKN